MPHLVYDDLEHRQATEKDLCPAKWCGPCWNANMPIIVRPTMSKRWWRPSATIPVALRDFRYVKPAAVIATVESRSEEQIALIVNDRHDIHHVNERGYVESPVRVKSILKEHRTQRPVHRHQTPTVSRTKHLHAVHDADFVVISNGPAPRVPAGKSLYPYIFPIRNKTRPPKEPSVLSGYYCIDTFTPINANAYLAARRSVDCALTAAREILDGRRIAYALIRPPGHHAERRSFGGFCYFNNNAIAAQYLCAHGKVAILDMDYHHGNGQQDIFYRRSDVSDRLDSRPPQVRLPLFQRLRGRARRWRWRRLQPQPAPAGKGRR